jgi:hypothetical protein
MSYQNRFIEFVAWERDGIEAQNGQWEWGKRRLRSDTRLGRHHRVGTRDIGNTHLFSCL